MPEKRSGFDIAAKLANILSLLPAVYCAYGTYVALHPPAVKAVASAPLPDAHAAGPVLMVNIQGVLISLVIFLVCVAIGAIFNVIAYRRNKEADKHFSKNLERQVETILARKGVLPEPVQNQPPVREAVVDEPVPKSVGKIDGEIYRVVTAPKSPVADMTRQLVEGMRKEFAIDIDILIEIYVVNTSSETQYIRDFTASVEIDGERVEMDRQKDFYAWEFNDQDFEYGLDPTPDENRFELSDRIEALVPAFPSIPCDLAARKPLQGWVRFLLRETDPKKLENNRSYTFVIVDSLGEEHQITRSRKTNTASLVKVMRKGMRK
jgi:hypothetical protein